MDLASPFARLMGKRWPWFMEMHLFYFTRHTMRMMLERAGFEIVWMGAQGRYLQAGYLASRVTALSPVLGRPSGMVDVWFQVPENTPACQPGRSVHNLCKEAGLKIQAASFPKSIGDFLFKAVTHMGQWHALNNRTYITLNNQPFRFGKRDSPGLQVK